MKYIPFNLDDAKHGFPVMNKNGDKVEIIRDDLNSSLYPLLGIITSKDDGEQMSGTYTLEGQYCFVIKDDIRNLVMAPLNYSGTKWLNLYFGKNNDIVVGNSIFDTEEEATMSGHRPIGLPHALRYIATVPVKIDWSNENTGIKEPAGQTC